MALKNERIIYVAKNFSTGLTDVTADVRRNGVSVATGVSLSDIGGGRYELLLTPAALTTYGGIGYYDFYINSASKNAPAVAGRYIHEDDTDDLKDALDLIEGKIDIIDTNVDSLVTDLASVKTTVEDTNNEVKDPTTGLSNIKSIVDAINSAVGNISNVTRFSAPIPPQLIRQNTGTKTYKIQVGVYDNQGNMEDPDSNEIQLQIKDESGNSRDSLLNGFVAQPFYITRDAQGVYSFELQIPDTAALEQLVFQFDYSEGTNPLTQFATSEVVLEVAASGLALEASVQDVLTDTADMQPRVADIQLKVNDATFGLAALKSLLDTIDANTDGLENEINNATYGLAALRTQLDLKASQSSVNTALSDLASIKGTGYVEAEDSLEAISERVFTGGQAI